MEKDHVILSVEEHIRLRNLETAVHEGKTICEKEYVDFGFRFAGGKMKCYTSDEMVRNALEQREQDLKYIKKLSTDLMDLKSTLTSSYAGMSIWEFLRFRKENR